MYRWHSQALDRYRRVTGIAKTSPPRSFFVCCIWQGGTWLASVGASFTEHRNMLSSRQREG